MNPEKSSLTLNSIDLWNDLLRGMVDDTLAKKAFT